MRCALSGFGGPIPPGAANARAAWSRRDGLLLRLEGEDGAIGHGEASPLPGYSPDTLDSARAALERVDWRALDTPTFEAALAALDAAGLSPSDQPSARFAAESALLDLLARRAGRPAFELLGARAPSPVPLAALVATPADAETAVPRGIRTLKVKVGRDLGAERALLASLRARFGPAITLRLDANGAYTPSTLPAALEAFAPSTPSLLEEPLPSWSSLEAPTPGPSRPPPNENRSDAGDANEAGESRGGEVGRGGRAGNGGGEVGGESCGGEERAAAAPHSLGGRGIGFAADESLGRGGEWGAIEGLVGRGVIRAVVLKPMLLGGFGVCLGLARWAAARGVGAYVTHVFDGPVGLAAGCTLALALPGPRMAAGLAPHPGLAAWPAWKVTALGTAHVRAWAAPGLPIEGLGL